MRPKLRKFGEIAKEGIKFNILNISDYVKEKKCENHQGLE